MKERFGMKDKIKVLFIGNSHTYFNDMPQSFADMCQAGGVETDVVMLAYSWKDLEWHMSKEYFTARFNILYGGYDYCVVQQGAHPFPGEETTMANAARIAELCRKAGTKVLLIETWAEKKYPQHQELLSEANRKVADSIGAQLVPVGSVWQQLLTECPEIDLFWKDGEHASPYGDYVISALLSRMILTDLSGGDQSRAGDVSEMNLEDSAGGVSFKDPLEEFDGAGKDFAGDLEIDFYSPRVLENVSEISMQLDADKITKINKVIIRKYTTENL